MSFVWSEYLNLAQELAGKTAISASLEAKLRSAISRAYYAAFIEARNHLQDKENHTIPFDVNPHEYVRIQFEQSQDKKRQKIGKKLNYLRIARNKADYNNTFSKLSENTEVTLQLASQVISALNSL